MGEQQGMQALIGPILSSCPERRGAQRREHGRIRGQEPSFSYEAGGMGVPTYVGRGRRDDRALRRRLILEAGGPTMSACDLRACSGEDNAMGMMEFRGRHT